MIVVIHPTTQTLKQGRRNLMIRTETPVGVTVSSDAVPPLLPPLLIHHGQALVAEEETRGIDPARGTEAGLAVTVAMRAGRTETDPATGAGADLGTGAVVIETEIGAAVTAAHQHTDNSSAINATETTDVIQVRKEQIREGPIPGTEEESSKKGEGEGFTVQRQRQLQTPSQRGAKGTPVEASKVPTLRLQNRLN